MDADTYIISRQLNLDLNQLRRSCILMRQLVLDNWAHLPDSATAKGTDSVLTQLFKNYNIFMYSYPEFYKLYCEIKTLFREQCTDQDPYYCQSWLNYYLKDEYINWHKHSQSLHCGYHGFFCVDTEPSHTTYRLFDGKEFDVIGKNNLLILSKNLGDFHRTWPWPKNEARITIAFDIVPGSHVDPRDRLNHWIPI